MDALWPYRRAHRRIYPGWAASRGVRRRLSFVGADAPAYWYGSGMGRGFVLPPETGYRNPEALEPTQLDCPAYGRLGLSGGIVCEIPAPGGTHPSGVELVVFGEKGQVQFTEDCPVFLRGHESNLLPVYPHFVQGRQPLHWSDRLVDGLLGAFSTGKYPSDGRLYHHALEIAMALVQSARLGRRIELPLEERSQKILPHPYRHYGGDRAGWQSIGYSGPPSLPD